MRRPRSNRARYCHNSLDLVPWKYPILNIVKQWVFIILLFHLSHKCAIKETSQQANTRRFIDYMRAGAKRSTLTRSDTGLEQEKVSKSFFAERRGFVEDKARTAVAPVVAITSRGANRARREGEPIDEGDRPERRTRFRNGGEV